MSKRGQANKKLQRPPTNPAATEKRIGDPSTLLPGSSNSSDRISWRFAHLDREGPWGFAPLEQTEILELLAEMVKFESQTINELFHRREWPGKCHDVAELPNRSAGERLDALGLSDMTKIWKLRIGGVGRLWGFMIGNVFHVVWWDHQHEVWPSVKRNT